MKISNFFGAVLVLVACMVLPSEQGCAKCNANCATNDCISYDITQQSICKEVANEAPLSTQCQWWANGLNRNTDFQMKKGRIIAYKLKWFSGSWSGWFVPEYNDHDCKYNLEGKMCNNQPVCGGSLRRWWSYFFDHVHTYIICI